MSRGLKTDPLTFWLAAVGVCALILFGAYCWFGVYVLGLSPHCHMVGPKGPLFC